MGDDGFNNCALSPTCAGVQKDSKLRTKIFLWGIFTPIYGACNPIRGIFMRTQALALSHGRNAQAIWADKKYDGMGILSWMQSMACAEAVIPEKSNRKE